MTKQSRVLASSVIQQTRNKVQRLVSFIRKNQSTNGKCVSKHAEYLPQQFPKGVELMFTPIKHFRKQTDVIKQHVDKLFPIAVSVALCNKYLLPALNADWISVRIV